MAKIEKDAHTGIDTTGHEWDGIKELNNPLPRWWILTFYACIAYAVGYTVVYPAWPMLHSATPGLFGYSSRADVATEIDAAKAGQAQWLDKIKAASLDDILKDKDLLAFARAGGAAAYKVNCVQCHGSGAAGAVGYPNLNDNDWLWGGTLAQINQTISHGVNADGDPDSHVSQMPVFGPDPANNGEAMLKPGQIADVANFTLTLSGGKADDEAAAARGKQVWADGACAGCHGEKGEGNKDLGAPNLSDAIWLFKGDIASIAAQVAKPRHGVMPAWGAKLDDTTIKQLAIFVYSLGGGEQTVAAQ